MLINKNDDEDDQKLLKSFYFRRVVQEIVECVFGARCMCTQVRVRVSLGERQVETDVQRVEDDVRRSVHLRCRSRVAVVASWRTALRGDRSLVSAGVQAS